MQEVNKEIRGEKKQKRQKKQKEQKKQKRKKKRGPLSQPPDKGSRGLWPRWSVALPDTVSLEYDSSELRVGRGDVTKFGRGDSASPAPATTLAQSQQNQTQTHHTTQQPFLNPTLPPGYSYTGLPYYAGVPGVPSAFQYGPTMFVFLVLEAPELDMVLQVPSASAKQHGVNLNTILTPFQQGSVYGQHGYGAGYDDLTQGTAAGDYSKGGYSGSSQAQNKSAGTGPGKGKKEKAYLQEIKGFYMVLPKVVANNFQWSKQMPIFQLTL
ncbi:hypothetical protein DUI87_01052 [Hirundo rustica rustica]|uniref:Uncharacterized protein n=1 Tax=Hirundo rustica rustica TaxID=333673 RepID=A0A3M0L560_HIRRU|nr:hypothetical protein DUI87_01052 [Hirundo rustica rustica]